MEIKTRTVKGLLMQKEDMVPKEHYIKIRLVFDENGGTLSLSDDEESIALAVALEDIQNLWQECN